MLTWHLWEELEPRCEFIVQVSTSLLQWWPLPIQSTNSMTCSIWLLYYLINNSMKSVTSKKMFTFHTLRGLTILKWSSRNIRHKLLWILDCLFQSRQYWCCHLTCYKITRYVCSVEYKNLHKLGILLIVCVTLIAWKLTYNYYWPWAISNPISFRPSVML